MKFSKPAAQHDLGVDTFSESRFPQFDGAQQGWRWGLGAARIEERVRIEKTVPNNPRRLCGLRL